MSSEIDLEFQKQVNLKDETAKQKAKLYTVNKYRSEWKELEKGDLQSWK